MNCHFVVDTDGTVLDIAIDGKPIARASMRGFRKAQKCSYFKRITEPVDIGTDVLTPLEATIFNFVKNWERRYHQALNMGIFPIEKKTETPVQTFDDMRDFFRQINYNLYMSLLD
jgi:hypothetical protein